MGSLDFLVDFSQAKIRSEGRKLHPKTRTRVYKFESPVGRAPGPIAAGVKSSPGLMN
jgi:hypothetical protein